MRFSPRTWSLLSVMLFVAAVFFWLKGNEYEERRKKTAPPAHATNSPGHVASLNLLSTQNAQLAQLTAPSQNSPAEDEAVEKLYPDRLRNTKKSLNALMRQDHSILLANALIDTDSGEPVNIPAHLRSQGAPGSYIVQWNGPATAEFRSRLTEAGAEIVSYVPNNAYFVKLSPENARSLEQAPGIQAVLPFEPYYKLQHGLLSAAVKQELLPDDALLRLTLLPGTRDAGVQAVKTLGVEVLAEENSPFGPQLVVHPPVDALPSLAALADIQGIEPETPRKAAADLSRVTLGVATNGSASNYFELTGSNVWVNINDTGIDTNTAALQGVPISVPPAPIPMAGTDPDGHGTFVASLIAGTGAQSPAGTNVPGSDTNALFRGMAPKSKLLALPLNAGGGTNKYPALNEKILDSWLIDTAARTNFITLKQTNALISNNSWTYGRPVYDSAAARFDAAVRDAIPGMTGSQPLLFVFAAGNSGFGNDSGTGGQLDTIESPATAKNVISVGALETFRLITNVYSVTTNIEFDEISETTTTNYSTNYQFAALTDSSSQVASFSSRGNVGVGLEGTSGRFKPDVVAPGTMLVAARSRGWNYDGFDTNDAGFGQAFFNLHTNIQQYRYDSGTTFAAANVSGMLALIQQYFQTLAPTSVRGAVSPALMKALLINGARSLTELYDTAVRKSENLQGWGLPSLPNSLTSFSTNSHDSLDSKKWHLRTIEQSATNALATGESLTWNVTLSTNAQVFPLRVTLAWTDPPGNPAVGIKLVNDLDLIVTNLDTGTVFYGNDIPAEADFTPGVIPVAGAAEPVDQVNNVENVAIRNPKELGTKFSITVRARRVNVNSVSDYLFQTRNTNDVVQDFALVISSDMGSDPGSNDEETYLPNLDVFDTFEAPKTFASLPRVGVAYLTNGLPLLDQRVGANATLVSSNGITNQWNFYMFTNVTVSNEFVYAKAGRYVAFVTFSPPELARPRNSEADIDIYVSKDPGLTNLNPAVINSALTFKATEQGGTETVSLTNATVGDIFYVGVKSEDQQAAEFSLIGVSSDQPFESEQDGRIVLRGVPIYAYVPDGTARKPVAGTMLAIGTSNRRAARTVAEQTVTHENFGDLVGVLEHTGANVILNNHMELPFGIQRTNLVYDDSTFPSSFSNTRHSDGPGSLNNFAGLRVSGAWFLQMIDNTPSHTGRVEALTVTIDPLNETLTAGEYRTGTLSNNQTAFFPIDVPPGVTNLAFQVTNSAPLEVYFRQFQLPQTNAYDLKVISTNQITFNFPTTNSLPLAPGTHYLALKSVQPNAVVKYRIRVDFSYGNRPGDTFNFTGQAPRPSDDATTNTTIFVQSDKLVAKAQVSLHMDYPRMSDLAVALYTPQGSRVLLSENRGGTNLGFGATTLVTNANSTNISIAYTTFTDDTNLARVPIKFASPVMAQNRTNTGIISSNNFEKAVAAFDGDVVEDPWIAVGFPNVVTRGAYKDTNALEFVGLGMGGQAGITTTVQTEIGRTYKVTFASRIPATDYLYWTERVGAITNSGTNFIRRMQLGSTNVETLLTNLAVGCFGGISVDPLAGYIYSGDRTSLFRTDLRGGQRTNLFTTQNAVTDVEFDPVNNWIYWAESGPFTRTNSIKRIRPDKTGFKLLFQLQTGQFNGIALDVARDTLYYTLSLNAGRDTIQAMNISSLQRRVISTLPNATVDPFDIDFDPTTQTLVFNEIGTRSFWRVGRDGSGLTPIFTNAFATINAFALNSPQQEVIFNGQGAINSRPLTGGTTTLLVRNRQTVNYEDVVHLTSGTSSNAPLVAEISFGSVTNSLIATSDWTTNTFYFTGSGKSIPLAILAVEGTLWIDNLVLEKVADTFVLPEEPFAPIIGQRAIGEWRLEMQDIRTGAFLPPGTFDWKLDLNFADPLVFAETLTGGSRFSIATKSTINPTNRLTPGILRSNDVHYFIIQPCAGAQNLTVFLQGVRNFGMIDLLADSSGMPTGNADTDDFVPMVNNQNPGSPNGVLEFRLSDKLPAPARLTAKPIFVALRNRFQDMTNIYSLTVASDGNCSTTSGGPSALQANVSEVSGLASASEYTANEMGLHALNIPDGAQAVRVNVEADADVSVIAQKDEPPTTQSFSHFQNVPGSGIEELILTADAAKPLTPGVWYVRVLNNTDRPISYTITATGDLTAELEVLSMQAEVVDGQLRLNWNGVEGGTYELQSSIDLQNWTPVASLPEGTSYLVPEVYAPARFYRVILQP